MTTTLPRVTCPVCSRDVAARRDGKPRGHYPPPTRLDLTWTGRRRTWCRGSREVSGGQ